MELTKSRLREKEKYLSLLSTRPNYGSSNHGKDSIPLVCDFLIKKNGGTIVDFGCGDNSFLKSFNSIQCCEYSGIGIDFVNPKADLIEPMHKVSLPDDFADVVTSFDALEHLLPDEVDQVLKEMSRIGKSKGIFIYSITTRPSKILSLGENLHPTVESIEWWKNKLNFHCVNLKKTGRFLTGEWL